MHLEEKSSLTEKCSWTAVLAERKKSKKIKSRRILTSGEKLKIKIEKSAEKQLTSVFIQKNFRRKQMYKFEEKSCVHDIIK